MFIWIWFLKCSLIMQGSELILHLVIWLKIQFIGERPDPMSLLTSVRQLRHNWQYTLTWNECIIAKEGNVHLKNRFMRNVMFLLTISWIRAACNVCKRWESRMGFPKPRYCFKRLHRVLFILVDRFYKEEYKPQHTINL